MDKAGGAGKCGYPQHCRMRMMDDVAQGRNQSNQKEDYPRGEPGASSDGDKLRQFRGRKRSWKGKGWRPFCSISQSLRAIFGNSDFAQMKAGGRA
ncbi:hypothetical protein DOE73_13305 [Paenibacillus dendritiformis]|nr:hypothetical protein DOE73_13305 [Paenibacillus dendritiformis]